MMEHGTILPGQGIPGITLGMSQREVCGVMGEPEEIDDLGLALWFENGRLKTAQIDRHAVERR